MPQSFVAFTAAIAVRNTNAQSVKSTKSCQGFPLTVPLAHGTLSKRQVCVTAHADHGPVGSGLLMLKRLIAAVHAGSVCLRCEVDCTNTGSRAIFEPLDASFSGPVFLARLGFCQACFRFGGVLDGAGAGDIISFFVTRHNRAGAA